jgi:FkbM family methyltransferase
LVHSQIGSLVSYDGKERIRVSRSQIGFALFGPYLALTPGNYIAEFDLLLEPGSDLAPDDVICVLDVASGLGTETLARQEVQAKQLQSGNPTKLTLPFSLDYDSLHTEFRVWSLGKSEFAVDVLRPVTAAPGPYISSVYRPAGFCAEHSEKLRSLKVQGANIVENADSAIISFAGVNVVARHREDFQIISEILVYNHYKILPLRDSIAIDIGMNIGLASVYLAKEAWAKKVYAYEPFRDPYERSKETFDANPAFKDKIFTRNAGLSGRNEKLDVRYDADGTIATGVKGSTSGPVQQIELLDAGEVFESICSEAEANKLGVIVKMDCEGSEFPIMKRLAERSLIDRIDAFMVEWHKGWSPDAKLKDLTDPLRAAGFVIFDHTVESDYFAGMFFAARVRPST